MGFGLASESGLRMLGAQVKDARFEAAGCGSVASVITLPALQPRSGYGPDFGPFHERKHDDTLFDVGN